MLTRIGFIGVGHLAEYLITGLMQSGEKFDLFLADPFPEKARKLARSYGGVVSTDNQMPVDNAELVILSTRPQQAQTALRGLKFRPDQILASVAVGVPLKLLVQYAKPARPFRVLPISCVAINQSPVLIYPDDDEIRRLFSLVGTVHLLPDENIFEPASSLVGAFYAWLFALMDEVISWTAAQGLDPVLARGLVVETMQGACAMAQAQKDLSLNQIWESLATPGGISEHGIEIINQKDGLKVWSEALESVTRILRQ